VLWRVLCGGTSRPDVFYRDDDELVRACHRELQLVLGVTGEPEFRQIVRWPRAIPQYDVGHLERVARVEAALGRHPGLLIAGNALYGVSMPDVAERARLVAERVVRFLQAMANG
jgi:oxygen-dependent protoporphyrinogen oxidase